jgi:beta-lactamase superfamily II metal-dependent hydrolase
MRTTLVCLLALVSLAAPALAQNRAGKPLEIYVVDVEGGNATLFVTPSGETVLIDTGNGARRRPAMRPASWKRPRTRASRRSTI